MNLRIKINMDNAAFEAEDQTKRFVNTGEPARILRRLADSVAANGVLESGDSFGLFDINGNKVGEAKVTR